MVIQFMMKYDSKSYRLNSKTIKAIGDLKITTGLSYNKLFYELVKTYHKIMDNDLTKEQRERLAMLTDVKIGDVCPHCKIGLIEKKHSRFGEFIGCDQFPRCAFKK